MSRPLSRRSRGGGESSVVEPNHGRPNDVSEIVTRAEEHVRCNERAENIAQGRAARRKASAMVHLQALERAAGKGRSLRSSEAAGPGVPSLLRAGASDECRMSGSFFLFRPRSFVRRPGSVHQVPAAPSSFSSSSGPVYASKWHLWFAIQIWTKPFLISYESFHHRKAWCMAAKNYIGLLKVGVYPGP